MGETVSSRFENILRSIIDNTPYTDTVHSKEEALLLELKGVIETGSGGSYKILGAYNTVEALETDHPTGNAGDAYLVGFPSHVFVWLVDDEEWSDAGPFTAIEGPQGPKGDDGNDGADGVGIKSVDINASNHLIVTYDDNTTHDAGALPSVPVAENQEV